MGLTLHHIPTSKVYKQKLKQVMNTSSVSFSLQLYKYMYKKLYILLW